MTRKRLQHGPLASLQPKTGSVPGQTGQRAIGRPELDEGGVKQLSFLHPGYSKKPLRHYP